MNDSPNRGARFAWWPLVPLAGYWLALVVATHLPRDFPLLPSDRTDKLVHAAAFALLAGLLAFAWENSTGRLTWRHLRAAWVVVALYAALDEWTQIPVGRTCSFYDWLADVVGAAIGLAIFLTSRNKFK